MKAVSLSMLSLLAAAPVFATCEAPSVSIKVPPAATGTEAEFRATKQAILDYDAALKVYASCLKGDEDAEIAALGDKATADQKSKVDAKYVEMQNRETDKILAAQDAYKKEAHNFVEACKAGYSERCGSIGKPK